MPKGCVVTQAGEVAALWQLATLDARIHEAERTELEIIRQRDAREYGADPRRAQLGLERVRELVHAAQVEREQILRALAAVLVARYEWLAQLGTLAFIVPVRDGRCAGCACRLSAAVLEMLQRPDVIGICPRCERMLHGRGRDA